MCLFPIKLRNPVSTISRDGGQKLYIEVPCGHCADCKKQNRLAWRFRTFHHVHETLNNGGFVYFDTLTYAPEHVPMLSHYVDLKSINLERTAPKNRYASTYPPIEDFMCFDNTHWRNFLKNLRRQLEYYFSGVKFTYFITSEYGLDERYTHRPHFHVLFFINNKELISNADFSRLVSKCWHYGRTDGMPYQDQIYIDDHTYYNKDAVTMKLCNYVSKYITKDSTFQSVIDERIREISRHLDDDTLKAVKRQINMFHRQSQGFGLSFLKSLNEDDINKLMDDSFVTIEDAEKVTASLPIPQYYKRKLFYNLRRDDEGKYFWQPNEKGVEYLRKSFQRNIANQLKNYTNQYINLEPEYQHYIDYLLNGRTFYDLAVYSVIYKDRCRALVHNPVYLTTLECSTDYVNTILSTAFVHDLDFNDVMHRDKDASTIYVPVYNNRTLYQLNKEIDYDTFIKNHIITEHSCSSFANFDKLLSFMRSTQLTKNHQTQISFEFIEELEQKFKHLLNYGI